MISEAYFPMASFHELNWTLISKTVCGSDRSFYCEVMKQLESLFLLQIFHICSWGCWQISLLNSFDLYLVWDGDLKATEFLKNTPETSDLKFDQYWPMIWRDFRWHSCTQCNHIHTQLPNLKIKLKRMYVLFLTGNPFRSNQVFSTTGTANMLSCTNASFIR